MFPHAYIFDVDGTLVDSNGAHAAAWSDALREFDLERASEVVRPLIGMGGDKLLPALTGISTDTKLGERILTRRSEIFADVYLPRVRPFPGARALLARLKADGAGLAIASSASGDELSELLAVAEVDDLVEHRTSSDNVKASKPDPDAVRAALDRLHVGKDVATMVGDTPYDVEAAKRAGIKAVAFRCGGWRDADLAGAAAIYDGPAAMLAAYEVRGERAAG